MTAAQIGESLIPWIPAIVAIIAAFVALTNRNRDSQDRRTGSWTELANENRNLRGEVDEQREKISELTDRLDKFERKTNVRIGALSNMLHDTARQWPPDQAGPYFSQEDLDALENTDVPFVWRNRVRPPIR